MAIEMAETARTKIALDTLGCKLNQAEAELLARKLTEAGYALIPSVNEADAYILNTCTVTHIADRKSRHLLRQAHRINPKAKLVAVGCYADLAPQELAKIEGVGLVLGNTQKSNLVERLQELGFPACSPQAYFDGARTRAFLKVQDGCHNFCAYCIVPFVRSEEMSIPVAEVMAEVKKRVAEGYHEVVLTGTEIGSYHCDGVNLKGLLERILAETDIVRLRLSSLQPQEISPEFIELWQDSRLCPHCHLSLQSGSDSVLARMRRAYTTKDYQNAVNLVRGVVPEAAITTDIIVGFPGETAAEFQESYDFCRQIEFARIHVFPYSKRRGTEAARMLNQISDKVKKKHSQQMLALAKESARNFHQKFLGKTMKVLWEQQEKGVWSGYTGNYIRVYTRSEKDLANKFLSVKLEKNWREGVWGELSF